MEALQADYRMPEILSNQFVKRKENGQGCVPHQPEDRQNHDVESPRYDQREMEQSAEGIAPAIQRSCDVCQDCQNPTGGLGCLSGAGKEEAQSGVGPDRLESLPWPRAARKKVNSYNFMTWEEQNGMLSLALIFVIDLLIPPSDSGPW